MNKTNNGPKEITLGLVASWILGILIILVGIASFRDSVLISLICFVMAAILLPPFNRYIEEKWNFKLSVALKIVIIIGGFYLVGNLLETPGIERKNSYMNTEKWANSYESNSGKQGTLSQQNALSKAESYLRTMPFSHSGLIEQLKYDQFSEEDARYAANNCNADWNEQAIRKAKSYLKTMAFSREGLIEQLEYDGFTNSQARTGAKGAGY
jgi:predicted PurR-regulated permease PerM